MTQKMINQDFIFKKLVCNCMNKLKINKIIIHSSNTEFVKAKKNAVATQFSLFLISCQKPQSIYSKNAHAAFMLRKDQFLGWKITLRHTKMHQFFEKLKLVSFSEQKEFDGLDFFHLNEKADCQFGFNGLIRYPELESNFIRFNKLTGINISLVTNATKNQEISLLLTANQMPVFKVKLYEK